MALATGWRSSAEREADEKAKEAARKQQEKENAEKAKSNLEATKARLMKEREEREAKEAAAKKAAESKSVDHTKAINEAVAAATANLREEMLAEMAEQMPGTLKSAKALLEGGGFQRRMTWAERRAMRRIEHRTDQLRAEITRAFDDRPSEFVGSTLDSLTHIEVGARLELMRPQDDKAE